MVWRGGALRRLAQTPPQNFLRSLAWDLGSVVGESVILVRRVVRGVLEEDSIVLTLSVTCAGVALALKIAAPSDLSVACLLCVVIPGPGFPFSRSLEIRFLSEEISGGPTEVDEG